MNNNVILESNDFLSKMHERFDAGLTVQLTVTGNSMIPFLSDKRDSVILSEYNGKAKKGDILLFLRNGKKCVLHRVIKTSEKGVYFLGDCQTTIEGPVPYENILAECHAVIRKGKFVNSKTPLWFFFKYFWINIRRLRLPVIRFITMIKNIQ